MNEGNIHLHFGLGAIGLGLAIPTLVEHRVLLVVQRPSTTWDPLSAPESNLVLKGFQGSVRHIGRINVIRDDSDASAQQVNDFLTEGRHVLLLTTRHDKFLSAYQRAASISTSVRHEKSQEDIARFLIDHKFSQPILLFENAFHRQIWKARGAHNLSVHKLVIDKICTRPTITGNDSVVVAAEDDEEVYMKEDVKVEFSNPKWQKVGVHEYNYRERKKLLLVNAVHAVLAVFGFDYLRAIGVNAELGKTQSLPPIISAVIWAPNSEYRENFEILRRMLIMRVIIETSKEISRDNHNPNDTIPFFGEKPEAAIFDELNEWSLSMLDRMQSHSDEIGRVLNTRKDELMAKWKTYVGESVKFLVLCHDQIQALSIYNKPSLVDMTLAITTFTKTMGQLGT